MLPEGGPGLSPEAGVTVLAILVGLFWVYCLIEERNN